MSVVKYWRGRQLESAGYHAKYCGTCNRQKGFQKFGGIWVCCDCRRPYNKPTHGGSPGPSVVVTTPEIMENEQVEKFFKAK